MVILKELKDFNLKEFRKRKNYTQIDLSKKLKVGISTYRLWEHGVNEPNLENLKKINEFMNEER